MTLINFITNIARDEISGGWSGMSAALSAELAGRFKLNYVGPINPGPDCTSKILSKVLRVSGRPGSFHAFSPRRLKRIANWIRKETDNKADADFFHGVTPWVHYRPSRPYFSYVDACFATYVDVYHDRHQFIETDLRRIEEAERTWLENAQTVFFSSKYALEETAARYGLNSKRFLVAGVGANVPVPDTDQYAGGANLLFVAHDFARKGGPICARALAKVQENTPEASLTILGNRPPDWVLSQPGVTWHGFLRKNIPQELTELQKHFLNAFALLLPTASDMTPLVIAELGLYGCPSIASRSFGIPEMVNDGRTGVLLDSPPSVRDLTAKLIELFKDASLYRCMRKAVRSWALEKFSWRRIVEGMAVVMESAVHCR